MESKKRSLSRTVSLFLTSERACVEHLVWLFTKTVLVQSDVFCSCWARERARRFASFRAWKALLSKSGFCRTLAEVSAGVYSRSGGQKAPSTRVSNSYIFTVEVSIFRSIMNPFPSTLLSPGLSLSLCLSLSLQKDSQIGSWVHPLVHMFQTLDLTNIRVPSREKKLVQKTGKKKSLSSAQATV